jgi:ubiquinone/menaquinone biosynthesis C-methylase UbiE
MSTYGYSSNNGTNPAKNTTSQPYDWESKQEVSRLLERERVLDEALNGPLPPGLDLPAEAEVLHLACGPGTWLYLLSLSNPSLRLTGVDKSAYYLQCARHYLPGVETVTLQLHSIGSDYGFLPRRKFDLVHVRFLAAELAQEVVAEAVAELATSCKHGGSVYWTECEWPSTNSLACEQLVLYLQQGLQMQRRRCILSSSTPGLRASMTQVLHDAGCKVVQDQEHVLDLSAGRPTRHAFVQQARVLSQQLRPLVVQAGVVSGEVYDAVAARALEQMRGAKFSGELFLRSMVAVAP